jgi:hypothetical protein
MQQMIEEHHQEAFSRPIQGFSWVLIGGTEAILFGGFVLVSWFSSSALLYALEASLFLAAVGLGQMLLVTLLFSKVLPLRDRLLTSCRLLPSSGGVASMAAVAHFVVALVVLVFLILGSLVGIITFPTYWWQMGLRFLVVSADLSLLFPLALKAMATQGSSALKIWWFLAGWTILVLGLLVGGLLDFEQRISPPTMILVCAWGSMLLILAVYWMKFRHPPAQ